MAPAALNISFERSRDKCTITIQNGIISRLASRREIFGTASSICVITDDIVASLYANRVKNELSKFASTSIVVFAHGERSKSLKTTSAVASRMSDLGLDRKSIVVALGGGVVGDLAGLVSSIYKRGIAYVQIPTTLLAQVDSSIGGKTGVDTDWGKNQLGTFYQPKAIFIDPGTLDTLPHSEVINGLGEMVKSGIISDARLFESIERLNSFKIDKLKNLIPQTCLVKTKVVEKDERENNLRSILNYGHTIGHAIEASSNYKMNHGKCVILGMLAEGWIGNKLGVFTESEHERQRKLLRKIIRAFRLRAEIDSDEILRFAKLDKKSTTSSINIVLPERIGKMHLRNKSFLHHVSRRLILESLDFVRSEL